MSDQAAPPKVWDEDFSIFNRARDNLKTRALTIYVEQHEGLKNDLVAGHMALSDCIILIEQLATKLAIERLKGVKGSKDVRP